MDINPVRLDQARMLVQTMVEGSVGCRQRYGPPRIFTTPYVARTITTFQQGGLEAYALDISTPQRYGIEQCVGDTLGPGGIFRALRTTPNHHDLRARCRYQERATAELC